MFESVKTFIVHLQNSDDQTRKRWLIILSGGSMFVVITLWVGYINLIVSKPAGPVVVDEKTSNSTEVGFAKVFSSGIQAITDEAQKQIKFKNEITIERPKENYQLSPDKLSPVPKTKLL